MQATFETSEQSYVTGVGKRDAVTQKEFELADKKIERHFWCWQ
jgi:hypothetical protein